MDTLPLPEVTFHPRAISVIRFGNQTCHQAEKKSTSYPLPVGEGQADTPIAQAHQGEVMTNPSPVSPTGEKPNLPTMNIALKN